MKAYLVLSFLGAVVSPALANVVARQSKGNLPPVTVKGNAFFAGNDRFYMRGVAYQPGGAADAADPLLNLDSLRRDVANFKSLGINTIRIYTIDNSKNHDEGMKMLDDAGIYLALDANTPKYSLNRETKDTLHRSYNDAYLQSVFATIDAFADYSNLLLFFSGNEVINAKNNSNAAPYIKAVTRDMKQYISNRASRPIPVGYSAADVSENIYQQATYFNCGTDDERSDFFAFNDYSWCDPSDFKKSGWDQKVKLYSNYSKPIFLSEFGCNTNTREWNEIAALYSQNMTSVYSGGLVYEYTVEPNGYGLVEVGSDGKIDTNADFDRLAKAYKATANPTGNGGFKEQGEASQCPAESDDWQVEGTNLPAIPGKATEFMDKGAGTGPGLEGDGSHFSGEPSESTATPGSGSPTRTPSPGSGGSGGGGQGAAAGLDVPLRFVGMIAASAIFGAVLLF
ncbi:13-beta-glucanosyltransferase gel1 precursor [Pyrenophora tritici-repentis]|uniref:1,3-beta-glucanosyltransferase n=2 Tax=Pyrenophora tritici-repentis TaxID=45151 RepID=A0A2W1E9G2_9PLEO|nr:1,3-beta-glucanosyltransferase gel1 precursor [Pyrenophora tritici-repentis Pt-1C-BFP]KAA8618163.1 1 3-beta-glucanosyltransferase [Pyrenophora tritici-repentis]EDU44033.1 1,3-beta-glucanosyltransferase gel1 precursor [Pyrenophora tritici-repentis Pt-1C-BFP]KAF7442878.1 1-3-beta-glucanosyltransferase [Pyrenophora tritici-repentis]KAF7568666.1 1,3-beta-glucanosyltransferase gel1 precursor [Pyrenophora tritici-repentis]KAG9376390.1 1,3-beta-glucanosyltransferase [Pyrenophora tritici-repentis]